MKRFMSYFSKFEIALWGVSVLTIILSFAVSGSDEYLTLIASLLGATSLILNAKGNVIGQILIIVFSVIYGIISYSNAYYGEMITYLGMSAPIAAASVITWLKNPFEKGKAVVKVNHLNIKEYVFLLFLTTAVTVMFYFILDYFNTALLPLSTLSVFTSFAAAYLTMRRCEFFAIAYAANDIVLIIMWVIASLADISYLSVVICFVVFLFNDIYGFVSWQRMKRRQSENNN